MAGILDILDNPDTLSSLLGIPPQGGGAAPGFGSGGPDFGSSMPGSPPADQALRQQPAPGLNMPMPPPRPMSPQSFDEGGFATKPDYVQPPMGTIDPNAAGGGFGFDPTVAAMPDQRQPPMPPAPPPGAMAPPAPGGIGSDAARTPAVPVPSWQAANAQSPGPPLNIVPPGASAPIPPIGIAGAAPGAAPQPRPPMNLAPQGAPTPPASTFNNVPSTQSGGLASALGLDPARAQPTTADKVRAAMSGLGKGLSAVGHLPAGASKGQAIAAGAGGSMEGTADAQQKQKDTLFNQSSTAFKDMIAAKSSGDTSEYRAAQSAYLTARAQSLAAMTASGGKGSNAWQNTPLGQTAVVEQRVAAYDGPRRKSIDAQVRSGALSQEDAKKLYDGLDKQVDGFRQNIYKSIGLDPQKAEKLRTAGEKADNPIDTKGMSLDQFHAQVPMGAWFLDQNGKPRQRTVPPPGSGGAARPQAGGAPNVDDQTAMNPAA